MWKVSKGKDVLDNKDVFILVSIDSNGNELRRAGLYFDESSASDMINFLNRLEVHAANVFANYIGIDVFLRRLIDEQEKVRFVKEMKKYDIY